MTMTIDGELKSIRADDLSVFLGILPLFSPDGVRTTEDLYRALGRHWRRARCYHYISALPKIGLATKHGDRLKLTPIANQLLEVNRRPEIGAGSLNPTEISLLRRALSSCRPFQLYLSLFMASDADFCGYDQLKDHGSYITLSRRLNGSSEAGRVSHWILTRANGDEVILDASSHKAIYWTMKYWAKSLDIIDELHPEVHKPYARSVSHILYPLKQEIKGVEQFASMLFQLVQGLGLSNSRLVIPELMYHFCTTFYVRTEDFLRYLVSAYTIAPACVRLERTSLAFIDEGPSATRIGHTYDQRLYSNYPRIGDSYFGSVVVDCDEGASIAWSEE